jgi:glutamine---fructose-6-phosphate transaminase (isomerizing)
VAGEQMRAEIAEQPAVLRHLADRVDDELQRIRAVLPRPLVGTAFLARGSSDNAALLGRYAVEIASGRPVSLVAPSIHTRYRADVDYSGYLVVALSQSGVTPEIVSTSERLREAGAVVVAVVNDPDSPLASTADVTLALSAGPELAVPATKTVTAQMATVLVVAAAVGQDGADTSGFSLLPEAVARLITDYEPVAVLAHRWRERDRLVVAARGLCFSAALETALKCKESSLVLAEGFSSADYLHGPIASLREGVAMLVIDGGGKTSSDVCVLADRASRIGADVIVCSASPESSLPLPPSLPESFQAIAATVRGQQLALQLGIERGVDPDHPSGLSKVTLTS